MKTKKLRLDQTGIAHVGLILIVLVFVAVGSLVVWRFKTTNKSADVSNSELTSEEQGIAELENSLETENADAPADEQEVVEDE